MTHGFRLLLTLGITGTVTCCLAVIAAALASRQRAKVLRSQYTFGRSEGETTIAPSQSTQEGGAQ
jgi:hypothetical protein